MRLNSRLVALETKRKDLERKAWVRILCHEGETPEAAIAEHEKRHGALGPDDNAIIRVIVHKPFPRPERTDSSCAPMVTVRSSGSVAIGS